MGKIKDITGQRFNKLVAIKPVGRKHGGRSFYWSFQCDCGVVKDMISNSVKSGASKSCGCERIKTITKHGCFGHPLYDTWKDMIRRCYQSNCSKYKWYGGKGITVCDSWLESPQNFINDMPERPSGFTLDRIDSSKNYCPENCRWLSKRDQARNRSDVSWITVDGETLTPYDWDKRLNASAGLVGSRIKRGWEPVLAATTPVIRKFSPRRKH